MLHRDSILSDAVEFSFWQLFRFTAPNLTASNVGILKQASTKFGCADLIVSIFLVAGFPGVVFQSIKITHDQAEHVNAHKVVRALTLTSGEKAG
jgi:succinate-semialdehyde dehydrogenase/glutarate-semialdehyde dehydrogenase